MINWIKVRSIIIDSHDKARPELPIENELKMADFGIQGLKEVGYVSGQFNSAIDRTSAAKLDSDNVVDARVCRLRKRVGKTIAQSLLQFIRGVDNDLSQDIQAGIAGWPANTMHLSTGNSLEVLSKSAINCCIWLIPC